MGKIVNNIEIDERIYNPRMDLYAVFGKAVDAHPKPFVVGWQKRDKKKIKDKKRFRSEDKAKDFFTKAVYGEKMPNAKTFYKDDQKLWVYAWEYEHIDAYAEDIKKSDAKKLIRKVSEDYGMAPPKLKWTKKGDTSYYRPYKHQIELAGPVGHTDATLLHELAHAIVYANEERSDDHVHHGPQFVWTVIELYQRYLGHDMQEMVISAHQKGLLGDLDAQHIFHGQRVNFRKTPDLE